jgi:hypothetical protein
MPNTVKVRIAVAVDPHGEWSSCGYSDCTDSEAFSSAIDLLDTGEARYILTAELEVPEVQVVAAEVERVEP